MKLIKHIAVLATAALMIATSQAADSFSQPSIGAHQAVSINPATGVQVYPLSFVQLFGFNGDLTNSLIPNATGTNYVIAPGPQLLYIALATNANFAHATNRVAGTYWKQVVLVKGDTADHTLTTPAAWNWPTNVLDTNHIIGKITTIQSNTFCRFEIEAVGTNVLARGQTFRQ